jgi:hypothetical protein
MNLHNPLEVSSRVNYYSVPDIPYSRLDGLNVGMVDQTILNNRCTVSSPFTISLSHRLSANYDSIYVAMAITATQNTPAGLKAHIAVIEKNIHFSTPPSNGEKDFFYIMKKMLPDSNGTTMPAMNTGQSFTIQAAWKLKNVYNIEELAVVGFIQDNATKEVKQAGFSDTIPVVAAYNYDVSFIKMINEHDCTGKDRCLATFINYGSAPLTSLNIKYTINNGNENSYLWSSPTPLNFLEQTTVVLPTINFSDETSQFVVYLTDPNGQTDQHHANDTAKTTIYKYKELNKKILLKINANGKPISWKILKPGGRIFLQAGPYTDNYQTITSSFSIPAEGCYKFIITNPDGDGLISPGYYKIYDSLNNILVDSTGFAGFQNTNPFYVKMDSVTPEKKFNGMFTIFPNPFEEKTKIIFYLEQITAVEITVVNILGSLVYTDKLGNLPEGTQQYILSAKNFKPGVYFVKLKVGDKLLTRKIVVN